MSFSGKYNKRELSTTHIATNFRDFSRKRAKGK